MANQINISKYISEVKRSLGISVSDEIIEKDMLLTLILAEFEKNGLGKELIFKGGTLLSRNYLRYHRFSEDLDFVHIASNKIRELSRNARERKIKLFIDYFAPELKKVADSLGLEFNPNRSDTRYCTILHGRTVYIFRIYYSKDRFIKIEINFVEKIIAPPTEVSVKAITDFFDSKELLFTLGLRIDNFKVLSYPLYEIMLEKYRAVLTRDELKERDLFDLFLIKDSLKPDVEKIVEKIISSSLIKRGIRKIIEDKHALLKKDEFFKSEERIAELSIVRYDVKEFDAFKERIRPLLITICERVLELHEYKGEKSAMFKYHLL